MLTTKDIEKFKKIYKEKYNILMPDEEATKQANQLISLYKAVLKPEKE